MVVFPPANSDSLVLVDSTERWHAVGSPIRLQLLQLLEDGACWTVRALAAGLCRTPQALYRHLDILERAGLVEALRDDAVVQYRVAGRIVLAGFEEGQPFADAWARTLDRVLRGVARLYRRQPATDGPVRGAVFVTHLVQLTEPDARRVQAAACALVEELRAAHARSAASGEPRLPYSGVVAFSGIDRVLAASADED
jgi:DNA-binding transcriptional ArsR family regulator